MATEMKFTKAAQRDFDALVEKHKMDAATVAEFRANCRRFAANRERATVQTDTVDHAYMYWRMHDPAMVAHDSAYLGNVRATSR